MSSIILGNPDGGRMIVDLEKAVADGRTVVVDAWRDPTVVKMEIDGRKINVMLSMVFSGTIDGYPYQFKKNYSFGTDNENYENALNCLLIANSRLDLDYDRFEKAGIKIKHDFFTLDDCFPGLTGSAGIERTFSRLADFILLARSKAPVSVEITLKYNTASVQRNGETKTERCFIATFTFTTGEHKTSIDKLYNCACDEDVEEFRKSVDQVANGVRQTWVANDRLKRDCERLRKAGIQVDDVIFVI